MPRHCRMVFGIPTCREEFEKAQSEPQIHDFATHCCPNWGRYEAEIVHPVRKMIPAWEKLSVPVTFNLSLPELAGTFDQDTALIILCSHWKNDCVEFADGLADISSVVSQVPSNFEGILDLCICHPTGLALELNRMRPKCIVRSIDIEATLQLWLYFYLAFFKSLSFGGRTYFAAFNETLSAFKDTF